MTKAEIGPLYSLTTVVQQKGIFWRLVLEAKGCFIEALTCDLAELSICVCGI